MHTEQKPPQGQAANEFALVLQSVDSSQTGVSRGLRKTPPLINRDQVRAFLLDLAKRNRHHKWTRVSEDTLLTLNEKVRAWCVHYVGTIPSKGKTL